VRKQLRKWRRDALAATLAVIFYRAMSGRDRIA